MYAMTVIPRGVNGVLEFGRAARLTYCRGVNVGCWDEKELA
jgi:hypothetical protein